MPTHNNECINFSKLYKNVSHCLCFVKFKIIQSKNRRALAILSDKLTEK